jgi:hypothetical protein
MFVVSVKSSENGVMQIVEGLMAEKCNAPPNSLSVRESDLEHMHGCLRRLSHCGASVPSVTRLARAGNIELRI